MTASTTKPQQQYGNKHTKKREHKGLQIDIYMECGVQEARTVGSERRMKPGADIVPIRSGMGCNSYAGVTWLRGSLR